MRQPDPGVRFTTPRQPFEARGDEMTLTYPVPLSPIDHAESFAGTDLVLARYRETTELRIWAIGTMSESDSPTISEGREDEGETT